MAAWDGLTLWAGALVIRSRKRELVDFPASPSYTLEPPSNRGLAYPSASPHRSLSCVGSTGMLTRFPSATPFGLALGPTNPERIDLPQETLGFRRTRFSRVFSLLVPAGSLPYPPPVLVGRTSNGYGMLFYQSGGANPTRFRSFGNRLEPR